MKLFKKNVKIYSPVNGKMIPITDVKDEVFRKKMLGDGVAFVPVEGRFYSPVKGVVHSAWHHAIGIHHASGVELLLHIGMDTVELNGKGFKLHVKENEQVNVGDLLVEVDFAYLQKMNKAITSPMIFAIDTMKNRQMIVFECSNVEKGDLILQIK